MSWFDSMKCWEVNYKVTSIKASARRTVQFTNYSIFGSKYTKCRLKAKIKKANWVAWREAYYLWRCAESCSLVLQCRGCDRADTVDEERRRQTVGQLGQLVNVFRPKGRVSRGDGQVHESDSRVPRVGRNQRSNAADDKNIAYSYS